MKFSPNYLNELLKLETPGNNGSDRKLYAEISRGYSEMRNLARNLLMNPGDKKIEEKLSGLLLKITKIEEVLTK